jgi:hypothetical protein
MRPQEISPPLTRFSYRVQHWVEEKERLKVFATALKKYNPKVRAPFVFSYWPGTTSLKDMLTKVNRIEKFIMFMLTALFLK